MCGLIAQVSLSDSGPSSMSIGPALDLLGHRGPDGRGSLKFQAGICSVVLGHTRLSIIDLSSGGAQPMVNSAGKLSVVFNGEIFNYRELRTKLSTRGHQFSSVSDTEVLLAAWAEWGEDCVQFLEGMFAFVIVDLASKRVFAVRDAFGIKPLYFARDRASVTFASEIPALMALSEHSSKVNLEAAARFLLHSLYDEDDVTFVNGIERARPGSMIVVDLDSGCLVSERQWWFPSIEPVDQISLSDAADRLRDLFLCSVKNQLRSDVPIGIALSGGVDSSAIASAARIVEPEIPVTFFSFVDRTFDASEHAWSCEVASRLGSEVIEVTINDHDLRADLDDLIKSQGEPFGSTSVYAQYCLYREIKRRGITVVLDGQGADELLGGYSGYPREVLRTLRSSHRFLDMIRFTRNWSNWPGRSASVVRRALLGALMPRRVETFVHDHRTEIAPSWIRREELLSVVSSSAERLGYSRPSNRDLSHYLRHSIATSGLQSLLRHGDRSSMRWSVESRVPFLSCDIAEFCLRLPEEFLVSLEGETKSVFRKAMRGIVPDFILDRRDKVGFSTPQSKWVRNLQYSQLGVLDALAELPFVDIDRIRPLLEGMDVTREVDPIVWRFTSLGRWMRLFDLSV